MSMTSRRPTRFLTQSIVASALAIAGIFAVSTVSPDREAHAQASRDAGAEQFVQVQAQRVVSILDNHDVGQADRTRAFRAVVDQIADVPRITTFVLGKYARTITPAQMQRFSQVFRAYEQNVYETQLGNFNGKTVKVTGSAVRRPGDVVVNTLINGPGFKQPLPVGWRVLGDGGSWKVVDVETSGVWLAITQQQDFVSTIDNNGGDIDALISQLQQQSQQHRNARPR
jgi:phospholipid transport system substrate-binding protein